MAWRVLVQNKTLLEYGDGILALVEALIRGGCVCMGSGDGGSNWTNNPPDGVVVNYWANNAVVTTSGAWIRLRFPTDSYGVIRELRIQKVSSPGSYSFFWSSDGTGFTGGSPSATVAPTASDQQYVASATPSTAYEPGAAIGSGSGKSKYALYVIMGDAEEEYSFYSFMINRTSTQNGYEPCNHLFLDVLKNPNDISVDPDPAIYGADFSTSTGFGQSGTSNIFCTSINPLAATNGAIAGWYKKGTADEAWLAYPIAGQRGYINASGNFALAVTSDRQADLSQGVFSMFRNYYSRSASQFPTSPGGWKGKSRIFRMTSTKAGMLCLDASRKYLSLGQFVIPWESGIPFGGF